MPIERARLDRLIALMDAWLQRRDREIAEGTYYDDDDEPPCNPLDAPPSEPFYSDGPPEKRFMASLIKSYGLLSPTCLSRLRPYRSAQCLMMPTQIAMRNSRPRCARKKQTI